MKKMAFVIPVALAFTLGWSGAISTVVAETVTPAPSAQTQATIEHMKKIRVNVNPTKMSVEDVWFNPVNGLDRIDNYYFDSEGIKKSEETRFYTYESTLFRRTASMFQNESAWQPLGVVQVNEKQVKMVKQYAAPMGDPAYFIAYIDESTGLPIKVEDYSRNDEVMTVTLYFFDHVKDDTSTLFKNNKKAR